MNKFKKLFNNKPLVVFLLCGLLGALIIVPNIILNEGVYSLIADFNYQQIPFNKIINTSIKNGSFLWTWYNELGSNFIGTFSFYNLFSPFNIIGYVFPSDWFEYLIGPIFILKYAVCGLTSYLFLKRYVKDKNKAIIGSLLYTFSGFQFTNIMFYHFHDVVAFFPLLLYTFDNLIYDNKKVFFALSVSLCAFTNWFFFIGECIFLIIYFFVKIFTKEIEFNFKKFVYIFIESILGIGLAMIVLLPCALFTMGNTRLSNAWNLKSMLKYPVFTRYLEVFRAFIFPSEIMSQRAVFSETNYSSVELYLPLLGSVAAISYFFKNKKNWISVLMVILTIFMLVPIFNSSFILFQTTYYARWFFMPTLVLSLMSVKCLEDKNDMKVGFIITLVGAVLFILSIFVYSLVHKAVYYDKYLFMFITFMFCNLIIFYYIMKSKHIKDYLLLIFISLFVVFWGNYNIYTYKSESFKTPDNYFDYLNIDEHIDLPLNSRSNSCYSCEFNYSYLLKRNNIRTFNSNINSSMFKFYESVGKKRTINTKVDVKDKDLNDFLGVEYIISCDQEDLTSYGYQLYSDSGKYKIYYNKDFKEFGFNVPSYITNKEFLALSREERWKILNTHVVLSDEQIDKFGYLFKEKVNYLSNDFEFVNNGFISTIDTPEETLAIYTIPFDSGFRATNNGKHVDIIQVNNGFMAVKLDKGINNLVFTYVTPGLPIGIVVSLVSLVGTIIYAIVNKRKKSLI